MAQIPADTIAAIKILTTDAIVGTVYVRYEMFTLSCVSIAVVHRTDTRQDSHHHHSSDTARYAYCVKDLATETVHDIIFDIV